MENMFERISPPSKKNLSSEFTKMFRKYYIDEEHCMDATNLFDNVKTVLNKFKNNGFKIAIASGKPNIILEKMLNHFEIDGFNLVLGTGKSNFKHKLAPEIIDYILEKENVIKNDAVIIGDCKTDILCGKNAKIDTIAVTYGYDTTNNLLSAHLTYKIDDFKELLDILELKGE